MNKKHIDLYLIDEIEEFKEESVPEGFDRGLVGIDGEEHEDESDRADNQNRDHVDHTGADRADGCVLLDRRDHG